VLMLESRRNQLIALWQAGFTFKNPQPVLSGPVLCDTDRVKHTRLSAITI